MTTREQEATGAERRIAEERDAALARTAELEKQLAETTPVVGEQLATSRYLAFRAEHNPELTAVQVSSELEMAVPRLKGVAPGSMDEEVAKVAKMIDGLRGPATTQPPGTTTEGGGEPSNPPETSTPGFSTPNPGAAGGTPKPELLAAGSEEVRKIAQTEGMDGIRKALADGRINISEEVAELHGL